MTNRLLVLILADAISEILARHYPPEVEIGTHAVGEPWIVSCCAILENKIESISHNVDTGNMEVEISFISFYGAHHVPIYENTVIYEITDYSPLKWKELSFHNKLLESIPEGGLKIAPN